MKSKIVAFFICVISFHSASANTFADIDLSYRSDDNVTRSKHAADIRKDSAIEITADYGKFFDFSNNWSMALIGVASYTKFSSYDALNKTSIGATVSAKKKFGLGAYTHALNINLSVLQNDIKDNKRDNNELEFGLGWSKRLSNSWELAATLSQDSSKATNSVFSLSGTSYALSTDYSVSESTLLSFGYSIRSGSVNTILGWDNPLLSASGFAEQNFPSVYDNAYKTDTGSGSEAYRINATTNILNINFSYAINDLSSFNVGYENQNSDVGYNTKYKNNIIRTNYLYAF